MSNKQDLFELAVLQILKEQPPSVLNTDFTLVDNALMDVVKRSVTVFNDIMSRDVTITEKHASIVATMASLVCEKALLEKFVETYLLKQ